MDDDALIEKILNEDSEVELSMTIQAYPVYDGKIYYTWKDTEAYEKILKLVLLQIQKEGFLMHFLRRTFTEDIRLRLLR